MSVVNPPGFLQNAGSTHTAEQMRNWFAVLMGGDQTGTSMLPVGGVNPTLGNKLSVTQQGSPNMSVIVKSGLAAIPGTESGNQGVYLVKNDADFTVTIATSDPTNPRIDIIVFKVQDSAYSGATNTSSIVAVTGTPAGSPSVPTAPANAIILAQVAVAANATSITNANITDTRVFLTSVQRSPKVEKFTSSGTWTKTSGARQVVVECVGSGGGGGGAAAAASGQHAAGSGGGGGAYARRTLDASALASTVSVTVAAGGAGGAAGNNPGTTGGNSSFGAHVGADGGPGGNGQASSATSFGNAGAAGATTGTGTPDLLISGSAGGYSFGDATLAASGNGGVSGFGFGGGAVGRAAGSAAQSLAGNTGGNYGGGGSGGLSTSTGAAAAGGAGGPGIVVVTTNY